MLIGKLQKNIFLIILTTGVFFCASQEAVAIVQAPAKNALAAGAEADHSGKDVTLFKNPVFRSEETEQEDCCQEDTGMKSDNGTGEEVEKKIALLENNRIFRKKEEERIKKILRKKRLAEKKKREEAKRRKEIQSCCGVSAGSLDREVLERIVEAEAGGETIHGRILVANVVLNRVKSKHFPSTIRGVVFSHRGSRYQFSPLSDGRYYSVTVSKGTKEAVRRALYGEDPSGGALYFMERAYARSSSVRWFDRELKWLFQYGCHEFYK